MPRVSRKAFLSLPLYFAMQNESPERKVCFNLPFDSSQVETALKHTNLTRSITRQQAEREQELCLNPQRSKSSFFCLKKKKTSLDKQSLSYWVTEQGY